MISQGPWDTEWMFYPKQQQCAIDIMDIMERHGQLHLTSNLSKAHMMCDSINPASWAINVQCAIKK